MTSPVRSKRRRVQRLESSSSEEEDLKEETILSSTSSDAEVEPVDMPQTALRKGAALALYA
jgi:hypothetical protein